MMNFPIPTSIGKIAKVKQASGNVYFYIRQFPLYYDSNGNEVYYKGNGFTSKAKAEKQRKILVRQRSNGMFKVQAVEKSQVMADSAKKASGLQTMTYYQYCHEFVVKRDLAEKTRYDYLNIVENRFKTAFGKVKIAELSRGLLQTFVDNCDANRAKVFVILKMTLARLYAMEEIPENYYLRLIRDRRVKHLPPKPALTDEQLKLFLSYFRGNRLEHAMYLIFYTGLREGELLALQWDEIDILNEELGQVHVNASWGMTKMGYGRKAPKTQSSIRVVPFKSAYLVKLLKRAKSMSKSNWVVENTYGTKPIESKNFTNRYFKEVSKKLGFDPVITSHVARHTYISHLVNQNVPYTMVAKLAGHATTEMVARVYAHPLEDKKQELAAISQLYTV